MYLNIKHGDRLISNVTRDDAEKLGIPEGEIVAAEQVALAKKQRDQVRATIDQDAGDLPSILGTVGDASSLAVLGVAILTVSVGSTTSYAAFKTALLANLSKLAGGNDMVAICSAFLSKIESGDVKIPLMVKGLLEVLGDIEARSTVVADALISAKDQT